MAVRLRVKGACRPSEEGGAIDLLPTAGDLREPCSLKPVSRITSPPLRPGIEVLVFVKRVWFLRFPVIM